MPQQRRKRVSDEVMRKICIALDEIHSDDSAPRTKREIEHRAGLSHDAVARAFRQDAAEDNEWNITQRLLNLTDGGMSRRSPQQRHKHEVHEQLQDAKHRLRDSESLVQRYAAALYAHQLSDDTQGMSPNGGAIPIGRNRSQISKRL